MPANEKRRYVMTSDLRQYIAEYTVANFWRYPIRRPVTYASALELPFYGSPDYNGLMLLIGFVKYKPLKHQSQDFFLIIFLWK